MWALCGWERLSQHYVEWRTLPLAAGRVPSLDTHTRGYAELEGDVLNPNWAMQSCGTNRPPTPNPPPRPHPSCLQGWGSPFVCSCSWACGLCLSTTHGCRPFSLNFPDWPILQVVLLYRLRLGLCALALSPRRQANLLRTLGGKTWNFVPSRGGGGGGEDPPTSRPPRVLVITETRPLLLYQRTKGEGGGEGGRGGGGGIDCSDL